MASIKRPFKLCAYTVSLAVKPYFHYGCALRCVAWRCVAREIETLSAYISRHATQRNTTRSRNGNKSLRRKCTDKFTYFTRIRTNYGQLPFLEFLWYYRILFQRPCINSGSSMLTKLLFWFHLAVAPRSGRRAGHKRVFERIDSMLYWFVWYPVSFKTNYWLFDVKQWTGSRCICFNHFRWWNCHIVTRKRLLKKPIKCREREINQASLLHIGISSRPSCVTILRVYADDNIYCTWCTCRPWRWISGSFCSCSSSCWGDLFKIPKLRRSKSDQGEIWLDCSWSKYKSVDGVGFLTWFDVTLTRWRPWRHFTQKSAATSWLLTQRLLGAYAEASASFWSVVHS